MRVNQNRDRVDDLLVIGNREFGTTLGVLARIDGDTYEVSAVQSNSGAYVAGEKYALGDSYCRRVFDRREIVCEVALPQASLELHHPLYRSLPLECFIGAPITRHGKLWGCVDFSSMAQRDAPFDAREIALIESLANEFSQLTSNFL